MSENFSDHGDSLKAVSSRLRGNELSVTGRQAGFSEVRGAKWQGATADPATPVAAATGAQGDHAFVMRTSDSGHWQGSLLPARMTCRPAYVGFREASGGSAFLPVWHGAGDQWRRKSTLTIICTATGWP